MSTPLQNPGQEAENQQNGMSSQAGKPQVWVRLRPLPNSDDSVFDISEDGKELRLMVEPEARISTRPSASKPAIAKQYMAFQADGILQNSSQEETYLRTVHEVVEKAMNGVSGVVVTLGPEVSGKNFSMFGIRGKYEQRGIVPRALEDIFNFVQARQQEMSYGIRFGVIELRRDKIRDLVTLCPYDLKTIGDEGPNGMLLQQIGCAEHGLVLLVRALAGQRYIHGPSYSHCHTMVYMYIEGRPLQECDSRVIKSRITFARIAAIPRRSKEVMVESRMSNQQPWPMQADGCTYYCGPNGPRPREVLVPIAVEIPVNSGRTVDEDIGIRRDLSFLEQMFIRVNEFKKLHMKYAKLKLHGAEMLMKPPKAAPSQTYRQNKLSHCLQDIISGISEIRIILLVRPERQYLSTTLEAMRFAERAKYIPTDIKRPTSEELLKQQTCRQQTEDLERQQAEELELKKKQEEEAELAAAAASAAKDSIGSQAGRDPRQNRRRSSNNRTSGLDFPDKDKRRRKNTLTRDISADRSDHETSGSPRGKKPIKGRRRRKSLTEPGPEFAKSGEFEQILESGGDKGRSSFAEEEPAQPPDSSLGPNGSIPEDTGPIDLPINAMITGTGINGVPFDWNVEGETLESGQPLLRTEPPTIPEAWTDFVKTPDGTQLHQDVDLKHKILRDVTREHNDVLQKVTMLLSVLNQQQSDLDIAQQIRHLRGDEYDPTGNIILAPEEKEMFRKIQELQSSRDDILEKLKSLKTQLYTQKQAVDAGKTECEAKFQIFCLEQYGMVFGNGLDPTADLTEPPPPPPQNTLGSNCRMPNLQIQNETDATKHYNELKRLAKEQARQFLRFYYQRPPWNNFATFKPQP